MSDLDTYIDVVTLLVFIALVLGMGYYYGEK